MASLRAEAGARRRGRRRRRNGCSRRRTGGAAARATSERGIFEKTMKRRRRRRGARGATGDLPRAADKAVLANELRARHAEAANGHRDAERRADGERVAEAAAARDAAAESGAGWRGWRRRRQRRRQRSTSERHARAADALRAELSATLQRVATLQAQLDAAPPELAQQIGAIDEHLPPPPATPPTSSSSPPPSALARQWAAPTAATPALAALDLARHQPRQRRRRAGDRLAAGRWRR